MSTSRVDKSMAFIKTSGFNLTVFLLLVNDLEAFVKNYQRVLGHDSSVSKVRIPLHLLNVTYRDFCD